MEVTKVSISQPTKGAALASARVEFKLEGEAITLDDVRIIKSRVGTIWIGLPTRNINGQYVQVVFVSPRIKRMLDEAILKEFALWYASHGQQQSQAQQPAQEGGVL